MEFASVYSELRSGRNIIISNRLTAIIHATYIAQIRPYHHELLNFGLCNHRLLLVNRP